MYSCAFSEVKKWGFKENESHMSDHLKNCRYNIRSEQLYPQALPLLTNVKRNIDLPQILQDIFKH